MSQPIAHHNFVPGSSRKPRNARTVLLRMAADQERADRIRALKRDHPEFTWQAVAERVGVSLRAAQSWQETGGIAYDNAKRLAELWGEDVDYIMRGERDGTPDPFAGEDSQLDRIEERLAQAETERTEMRRLIDEQNANLARQSEILERLEQLVSVLTGQDEDAGHPLRTVAQAARVLEAARRPAQTDQPAAGKRGRGGPASSQAS